MLPASIQVIHAFENHEHTTCTLLGKQHFHQENADCDICFFYLNDVDIPKNTTKLTIPVIETAIINLDYNFLLIHQPLSFSLRGPPLSI